MKDNKTDLIKEYLHKAFHLNELIPTLLLASEGLVAGKYFIFYMLTEGITNSFIMTINPSLYKRGI